jgi:hypothetical protein
VSHDHDHAPDHRERSGRGSEPSVGGDGSDGHSHGPLEAITHVHGGPMVLDIGGSVGALHVVLDDEWAGHELFLASDEPAFVVHTGVWRRHVAGSHVTTALFDALEAGRYRILDVRGCAAYPVEVRGGELVEVDCRLTGAAPAGPGR